MKKSYLYLIITAALLFFVIAPVWIDRYWLQMLIYVFWMVYLASAWHLVLSGGLFSLMHGLFVGAGAYTTTLLWLHLGVSPWLGMLAGAFTAAILAIAAGRLILREKLTLLAFAAITLAFSFMGTFVVSATPFLGASGGLSNSFIEDNPWNFQWVGDKPYYYIILIMVAGVLIICNTIFRSRLGLYLRASAENSRAAAASGVNIFRTRMSILVISAVLTSLGGSFWTQYANYIDPMHTIGPITVVSLAMLVLIGGTGTIWGPVLGPMIMIPISWILGAKLGGRFAGIDMLIYGFVIIIIFRFFGKGIIPWFKEKYAQRQRSP
ncbi:MAG: branched-chain amino acid ABC transporter permease [Dehalococcoidales bacterium]|nr:branched-chain amino acid ABC transporter permease [Dehalococcoidales bacterium]